METILYIEDDPVLRENTREMLEFSNFKVLTAKNGKIGVDLALKHSPDIILCDIIMPVWDGYKVFQVLKENRLTYRIPFIFVSAKVDKEDIRSGMNLGADDYLTKPFEEEELISTIQSRLEKYSKLQENYSFPLKNSAIAPVNNLSDLKDYIELNGEYYDFKRKSIIYREDENANYIYLLEDGIVKNYKMDEYGKELITGLYKKGDLLGFYSFGSSSLYAETSTALEDGMAYRILSLEFRKLLKLNPGLTLELADLFSENLTNLRKHLLDTAYGSVLKKTTYTILQFAENIQETPEDSIKISRSDLASVAGISTESLIRSLSQLKKDNLIDIEGRNIKILDLKKLHTIR
ncbi:response regulator [Antarcticibacterium arcticum]|uniref:Response regulator n=1 Tax=Antarcticibacterium arcticum TaxID=2585771 RepID=A0A5B8YLR4_9FLAO|nr:response regulator [Antarcticibacterium arcticum]QED37216.1 response regulator [Antarcticibacterium arcticum]